MNPHRKLFKQSMSPLCHTQKSSYLSGDVLEVTGRPRPFLRLRSREMTLFLRLLFHYEKKCLNLIKKYNNVMIKRHLIFVLFRK